MSDKLSDRDRLEYMVEAIERIFRFTKQLRYQEFVLNEMAQFAIIKNFEIIGEAASHLSKELKENSPHIEWRKIIAFRHILVHDYYKINPRIVWNAIEQKLGGLKKDLEEIIHTS